MKRCRRLALSCIIFFAFIFSACGGNTGNSSDRVIDWWHIQIDDPGLSIWQELADQFEADHPGVTINITVLENEAFKSRLTTVMQSNDPPDLFQSWGGGIMQAYADAGLLREITSDLEGEWGDSFSQTSLDVYSSDGVYYGAPYDMGAVGFWYNKDLFEQAGITEPPATWTDFLDVVQKLKDANITPIALGGRDKWPGHFYWTYLAVRLGGQAAFDRAYDRTGAFTDETFVKAGEYLQQLIDLDPFQEGYLDATFGDETTAVATGNAAMDLMGQWASDNINRTAAENEQEINLDFLPLLSLKVAQAILLM